jgi:hypothetical protein
MSRSRVSSLQRRRQHHGKGRLTLGAARSSNAPFSPHVSQSSGRGPFKTLTARTTQGRCLHHPKQKQEPSKHQPTDGPSRRCSTQHSRQSSARRTHAHTPADGVTVTFFSHVTSSRRLWRRGPGRWLASCRPSFFFVAVSAHMDPSCHDNLVQWRAARGWSGREAPRQHQRRSCSSSRAGSWGWMGGSLADGLSRWRRQGKAG